MGTKATVQVTYAVTFTLPEGMTLKAARAALVSAFAFEPSLKKVEVPTVKVHLTNKETSYGKR